MIIFRYIARDLLGTTAAVCAVLMLVIISGRFVKYLAEAAAGLLDANILFAVIGYRLPGFLELILPLAFFLGILLVYGRLYVDSEMTGRNSENADFDGSDENGVTFGEIRVGQLDATVTVNVQNAMSPPKLDAWIDFNGDGSWGGPGEHVFVSVSVVNGDNHLTFDVPAWAVADDTFARFRLSSQGDPSKITPP